MGSAIAGRHGKGLTERLFIRVEKEFKRKLERKATETSVSKLVRDFLKEWAAEHGCEKLDTELDVLNLATVLVRLVDREVSDPLGIPRLSEWRPATPREGWPFPRWTVKT